MFPLFISLSFTSFMYLIFRVFPRYRVDAFPTIIVNYLVCILAAAFYIKTDPVTYIMQIPASEQWLGIGLGALFISVFFMLSRTTDLLGVAGSTIVSRMSLIIPSTYAVIGLGEDLGLQKITGIILALAAIYFTVFAGKANAALPNHRPGRSFIIPLIAFIGTGAVDTLLAVSQYYFMPHGPDPNYTGLLFSSSFATGFLAMLFNPGALLKLVRVRNIFWGALLGLCNFFSLRFFFMALSNGNLDRSIIYPINSVGIVVVSTVLSLILFHDRLKINIIIGITLGIAAILLISLS